MKVRRSAYVVRVAGHLHASSVRLLVTRSVAVGVGAVSAVTVASVEVTKAYAILAFQETSEAMKRTCGNAERVRRDEREVRVRGSVDERRLDCVSCSVMATTAMESVLY